MSKQTQNGLFMGLVAFGVGVGIFGMIDLINETTAFMLGIISISLMVGYIGMSKIAPSATDTAVATVSIETPAPTPIEAETTATFTLDTSSVPDAYFKLREEREKQFDDLLREAKLVRVSGISLRGLIDRFQQEIAAAAKNGLRIEMLIALPQSSFLESIDFITEQRGPHFFQDDLAELVNILNSLDPATRNKIAVRFSPKVFYNSVIQASFETAKPPFDYMVVDLYGFAAWPSRSMELWRAKSPTIFEYFSKAEQERWADPKCISLDTWLELIEKEREANQDPPQTDG